MDSYKTKLHATHGENITTMHRHSAKRARLPGRDVATSPISGSNREADFETSRWHSQSKLKAAWEAIIEKYGKDTSNIADEIEVATGRIVVDRGHLRGLDTPQSDSVWRDWDSDGEGEEASDVTTGTCVLCQDKDELDSTSCEHTIGEVNALDGIKPKPKKKALNSKTLKLGEQCYFIGDGDDDLTDELSYTALDFGLFPQDEKALSTPQQNFNASMSLRGSYSAGAIGKIPARILHTQLLHGFTKENEKLESNNTDPSCRSEQKSRKAVPRLNPQNSPLGTIDSTTSANLMSSPPSLTRSSVPCKPVQFPSSHSSPPLTVSKTANLWVPAHDDPLTDQRWYSHHPDGSPPQFRFGSTLNITNQGPENRTTSSHETPIPKTPELPLPRTNRKSSVCGAPVSKLIFLADTVKPTPKSTKRKRSSSPIPEEQPGKQPLASVQQTSATTLVGPGVKAKVAIPGTKKKRTVTPSFELTTKVVDTNSMPAFVRPITPLSTPQAPKLNNEKTGAKNSCSLARTAPNSMLHKKHAFDLLHYLDYRSQSEKIKKREGDKGPNIQNITCFRETSETPVRKQQLIFSDHASSDEERHHCASSRRLKQKQDKAPKGNLKLENSPIKHKSPPNVGTTALKSLSLGNFRPNTPRTSTNLKSTSFITNSGRNTPKCGDNGYKCQKLFCFKCLEDIGDNVVSFDSH